ncbi:MAG TPA: glycosyltransferase, partial [Thermoanaerobaculia bacterium]|nr:glycosyltransferase [Thermoanaerobaculia bacterium]
MRILFLINHLTGAGAERQTNLLAAELQRRGHTVLIGYIVHGPGTSDVPSRALRLRRAWSPLLIADIVKLIREWKPELVQVCLTRMEVTGAIACRMTETPFVLREASTRDSYGRELKNILRVAVGRMAEAIVANSPDGAEYWSREAPKVPRFMIRNGIARMSSGRAEARPTLNGVYVGRLVPEKNVDVFLRACAGLDVTLFICGDGPQRAKLESLARELRIDARFLGFVNDPSPYQRAADFAALLSDFEGHPNAACEALAAGAPLVLSDIRAHRELAEAAMLVPPHDVEATARAIRAILAER